MRWALGLVGLLIAMAVVLSLNAKKTQQDFDAVRRVLPVLNEGAVTAVPFDEAEATRLLDRLDQICGEPAPARRELERAAASAAGWAAASTPGSGPHHAAVAIRGAASELLAASADLGDRRRTRARQLVADARAALGSGRPVPGGPASAIRDQLRNLEYSQKDRTREALDEQ